MKYNKEILEDIMLDAKHGLSLAEIAVRICIPEKDFFADYINENTQVKLFYDSGRSQGKIETDKALYELAKNGSSTAKTAYDNKMKEAVLRNKFTEIFEA